MKILITGGTGFIGRHLIDFYKKDNLIIETRRGDDLTSVLNTHKPDVVINSAAEIYKNDLMWESNVVITKQCLDYVKSNPDSKMIQIGSSSEYGILHRAAQETDPINPVDMYQATKGMATIMCQGYARTYDLDISVVRPYSVFGPYEKPHRLFPRLWKAFCLNESMTLYDGYHDFIYIDDFVRAIDLVLKNGKKGQGDIINAGSGRQVSNFEVYELFKNITGRDAPVKLEKAMAKKFESTVWQCDTSYALRAYQFQTLITLEEGIEKFLKTAQYQKENS